MLMRKRPERGEKILLRDKTEVIALEPVGKEHIRVILPDGTLHSFHKDDIDLPIINTKYYEKIDEH